MRIVAVLIAVALVAPAIPANASPLGDKLANARRVKARIDELTNKAEVATEDWDAARIAYDAAHAKVAKIDADLARIGRRTSVLQTSLDTRADYMYRSGPLGLLDVLLGSSSFADLAATWDFLNEQNRQEARAVAELKGLRAKEAFDRIELAKQQAAAKKVYDVMAARRHTVLTAQAQAESLLRSIQGQIAALESGDRARRAADARAHGGGSGGTGWNWGDPPHSPRAGLVAIALRYLGSPYHWASSGPHSFDCSGFTMFVFAQVGVSLPHSSRAQAGSGARVSQSNLEPGDLVFFGSPIHHVGIYIGGGRMIHSPHSGDVVSIDPVFRGDYAGACRP